MIIKVKSTGRLRCALYRLRCAFVDDSFYLIDNGEYHDKEQTNLFAPAEPHDNKRYVHCTACGFSIIL